jgi:hypothetical protein
LPGVREIRSALAGGYLWIAVFWLALDPSLGAGDFAAEPYRSAQHLGDAVGPLALGIAINFAAYLIGTGVNEIRGVVSRAYLRVRRSAGNSLPAEERMQILDEAVRSNRAARQRLVDIARRLVGLDRDGGQEKGDEERAFDVRAALNVTGQLMTQAVRAAAGAIGIVFSSVFAVADLGQELITWIAKLLVRVGADPYRPYLSADGVAAARRYLARETSLKVSDAPDVADLISDFPVLRMRLIHGSPDTASEVDRLNAEADFRSAIILPLLVIAVIFAIKVSLLFFLFWPLLLALRATARHKRYEAGELMVDALIQKVIEAPTIEMHRANHERHGYSFS